MLAAVQTLIGPNLAAVLFLKYALLISTCIFTYLAASRLLHNRSWAALAAFSLSLCFEIGWSMHEGVTYTAALTTMVMGTLWVFLRLCDRGAWPDYLLFGIFCALGLLSNYNFIIFLAILLFVGSLFAIFTAQGPKPTSIIEPICNTSIYRPILRMAHSWRQRRGRVAFSGQRGGEGRHLISF